MIVFSVMYLGKQREIPTENFFKKDNTGWTPLLVASFNGA